MIMGCYNRYVLPRLIHLTMQNKLATAERATWVPLASGKVLEVGIDPSGELWDMARSSEAIPVTDRTFDTVVITLGVLGFARFVTVHRSV
jgi:hypothetical protein